MQLNTEAWRKIVEIQAQIDRERDKIEQRRADRVRSRVIEGIRYPHPTALSISIIDIGAQTPNVNLKICP